MIQFENRHDVFSVSDAATVVNVATFLPASLYSGS
jgi:hypothetical protein